LIAVKDWAKPPSDHVDPYHLGIRFVGFLTAEFVVEIDLVLAEIYLLKFALLLEAIYCWRRSTVVDLDEILLFLTPIDSHPGLCFDCKTDRDRTEPGQPGTFADPIEQTR
jgi:hypothetical protein